MPRIIIAVAFILLLDLSPGWAQQQRRLSPGAESYTPSRIEWLWLHLQASNSTQISSDNFFSVDYVHNNNDTITIFVRYLPQADRSILNARIESVKKIAQMTAKSYGWDSWVKFVEDVKISQPSR